MIAVTFDFGQTLAELDHEMLCRRVSERGARLDVERARAETAAAWLAYGEAKVAGLAGHDAWCTFMRTLLERAGVVRGPGRADGTSDPTLVDELAEWLWEEQPAKNLWRKPVAGMFSLVEALVRSGVPAGIVSNSEGKIAELAEELRISGLFSAIADSGVLGIEKPDPRIFEWAAHALGVATTELVHVGDAWEADIVGALRVGARAVWFAPADDRKLPDRVLAARDARELRKALADFGVPITDGGGATGERRPRDAPDT